MSAVLRSARSVVTIIDVEESDGSKTLDVVLGVLGGLALVFFVVVIAVPVIRWRKRSSTIESRASSRRTHERIFSGNNQDAVAPLLEEQPVQSSMMVNEGAPTPTLDAQNQRATVPSRPPTALLNWKILQTLPNFDNDSDTSSLGKPLEPEERTFKEGEPTLRLVQQDRRSAALPPIPAPEDASRSSTLVAPISPTSPLIHAFQRALTPSVSDNISHTNSISTFRYPSLSASTASMSPAPTINSQIVASNNPKDPTRTTAPSWLPRSLVPGGENPTQTDSWWRVPSMPPIPESAGSASISSLQRTAAPKQESPPSAAHLRDSNANAGPSMIRHAGRLSSEYGTAGTLSRSSTQQTNRSTVASIVERPISVITHGTFGRQGHSDGSSREASDTKPPETYESGWLMPTSTEGENVEQGKQGRRRTFDYPREPSPPLNPAPLSAPPVSLRTGNISRSNRPSSQPIPDPQSPDEAEPESGTSGPYGHNQEASNSSEHLLPSSDSAPLLPEIPPLPQLSPLGFEFRIGTPAASRNNSSSTRQSRKSIKEKGKERYHEKSPSKASTGSALSSAAGSKRSLRSLRSLASFASTRSGSTASRSKSRERSKHSRHVTFGEVENPPPVPSTEGHSDSVDPAPEPRQPIRKASRPLPTPPSTVIPALALAPSSQQTSGMTGSHTAKGGYDVP